MIPNNFITDPRLTTYDFKVLCYLCMLTDEESRCFPSYETIAKNTGIGVSTVKRVVKKLEICGILTKEIRENNYHDFSSNRYTMFVETDESDNSGSIIDDIADTQDGITETQDGVTAGQGSVTAGQGCITAGQGGVTADHNQYIYTNNHNTNTHYTNQSTMCLEELMDRLDEYELKGELKRVFEKAIEVMYTSNSITVGGEDIPRDKVRKRLENLTLEHIAAVDRNKPMCLIDGKPVSNVNNPIAYTVTALYNSLAFTEEEIIDMEYGGT